MPDYFDRLLARYAPVAAADDTEGSGARVYVRPRLPGPFERAEAVRQGPPEPDEPAALIPSAPPPASGPPRSMRPEREVHTERHTVVRTEQAPPPGESDRPVRPPAPAPTPLLRPSAAASALLRPGTTEGARAARQGDPSAPDAPAPAPSVAGAPAPAVTGFARTAAPVAPRDSDTAAARGATPGSVGRRAPRPADRVVHVRIGRLEVSAAPPPGANGSPGGPPAQQTGRPAPVLTLDDYLSRGGKRD
ncbi:MULTISPECIES: hypothetical protein [unclassified Streptomyces]|uniref:hypothetical protein n=1 Tax=unclassified Streptomyces TaxID=2593676 RepID=UPI00093E95DC|nr:hypothetical protein [Streptomyces sp. TSRI0281]OKI38300.1 hypothetical protein A6A29_10005 [Streptomyces sp. TSRI0281]